MIHTVKGNLLDVTSGYIVHGCNSHGVMGAGVAFAIKNKWPENFKVYEQFCWERRGTNFLGEGIVYCVSTHLSVCNLITQENTGMHRRQVNYAYLAKGFIRLFEHLEESNKFPFIHFPMIGAGLGGGDWDIISQIIDDADPSDKFTKTLWVL